MHNFLLASQNCFGLSRAQDKSISEEGFRPPSLSGMRHVYCLYVQALFQPKHSDYQKMGLFSLRKAARHSRIQDRAGLARHGTVKRERSYATRSNARPAGQTIIGKNNCVDLVADHVVKVE